MSISKKKAYVIFKPDLEEVLPYINKLKIVNVEYAEGYNCINCKAESGLNVRIELPYDVCNLLKN